MLKLFGFLLFFLLGGLTVTTILWPNALNKKAALPELQKICIFQREESLLMTDITLIEVRSEMQRKYVSAVQDFQKRFEWIVFDSKKHIDQQEKGTLP